MFAVVGDLPHHKKFSKYNKNFTAGNKRKPGEDSMVLEIICRTIATPNAPARIVERVTVGSTSACRIDPSILSPRGLLIAQTRFSTRVYLPS
ncbi:hypothetical protein TNIN_231811 [Trichonephila inaurata madagascariensis]|uniref:Uncharacterized protein n=1 Tax=Trichonephila inaurata madagascariensis TaxID=2747483 RepID=A0A8X6MFW3_9ARAC|nr:hypothetical protein TNIN_231811 [Trichonephila inaurata madagascariensis]